MTSPFYGDRPLYFDREGKPLSMIQWAMKFEDYTYQRIDETFVDDIRISTVWMGLYSNFEGPPQIFETMIFGLADDEIERQWRYPTELAARAGHDQAVALVKEVLAKH